MWYILNPLEKEGAPSRAPLDQRTFLQRRFQLQEPPSQVNVFHCFSSAGLGSVLLQLFLSAHASAWRGCPGFIPPLGPYTTHHIRSVQASPSQPLPMDVTDVCCTQPVPSQTSRGVVPTLWEVSASDRSIHDKSLFPDGT